jgi:hypothetical protein
VSPAANATGDVNANDDGDARPPNPPVTSTPTTTVTPARQSYCNVNTGDNRFASFFFLVSFSSNLF